MSGGWYSPSPGEVITAANWKAYVRDQTVNHFASASARSSAITSPAQGMASYRDDLGGGNIETYSGTAWVPAGAQLISASTLGSAVSSVTFASIPGVYSSLMLAGLGAVTGAVFAADCSLVVNGDSGANYSNNSVDTSQAGLNPAGAFNNAQTSAQWAITLPGTSWGSPKGGGWTMHIPGYANTSFEKVGMANTWQSDGGTSFTQKFRFWLWKSTSAITSLAFTSGSGNFATGSHFALYGLP